MGNIELGSAYLSFEWLKYRKIINYYQNYLPYNY